MSGLDININVTINASEALLRLLAALTHTTIAPPSPAVSRPARTEAAGVLPHDVLSVGGSVEGPSRAADPNLSAGGAATPSGRSFKGWLTPERSALLQQVYPVEVDRNRVYAALWALSGPPMPPWRAVVHRAKNMGLHRPPECVTPKVAAMLAAKAAQKTKRAAATRSLDHLPLQDGLEMSSKGPAARGPDPALVATPPATAATNPLPSTPIATLADAIEPALQAKLIALARPAPPPVPRQPAVPAEATQNAIHAWYTSKGKTMRDFDLATVNAYASSIGHPGFILKAPERRHA